MNSLVLPAERLRMRLTIRGAVQGVGFRPFVYRLATGLGLTGWVKNSPQGVFLEVEGEQHQVEDFLLRIESEKPPLASIHGMEPSVLDARGDNKFEIRASEESGEPTALVLPDVATCEDCRLEIFDPANRRYRYPFTNCTNCGPRFSIMEALPYDRQHTTMQRFAMCKACRTEYEDPRDRRFHAQPNACAECGPQLELWNRRGERLASHHDALRDAAESVRAGGIVAVKGLGGIHLIVDSRNGQAVRRLRQLKSRAEKPFAVMVPSLEQIEDYCFISPLERRLLLSPEAPIVLLRQSGDSIQLAPDIAPGNPYLGVMLPYTPLHHLLMAELGFPIVATSGNLSDETICTDERDALDRLGGVADLFLVHNRPIMNHADDSVVRIMAGRELVLRRARGFAPLPFQFTTPRSDSAPPPVLALGGHLKNTVALSVGRQIFVSQHIGDLETAETYEAFLRAITQLERMRGVRPEVVACDTHPDYLSTQFASQMRIPVKSFQHHVAHVASCAVENEIGQFPVLGVAWDGSGYGTDGTVWGGEFLRLHGAAWQRLATFRAFPLSGGEAAVKEPRRSAFGLLYALFGPEALTASQRFLPGAFSPTEARVLLTMLQRGVHCPLTSSVGRLFDAVAALAGLRQRASFEGQAAMDLERALDGVATDLSYPFEIAPEHRNGASCLVIDWRPLVLAMLDNIPAGVAAAVVSARFHNTLAEIIVGVAQRIGEPRVVLTGGCFQNRYLTERTIARLRAEGFRPYWHQRIPPNDGGIALGQAALALHAEHAED